MLPVVSRAERHVCDVSNLIEFAKNAPFIPTSSPESETAVVAHMLGCDLTVPAELNALVGYYELNSSRTLFSQLKSLHQRAMETKAMESRRLVVVDASRESFVVVGSKRRVFEHRTHHNNSNNHQQNSSKRHLNSSSWSVLLNIFLAGFLPNSGRTEIRFVSDPPNASIYIGKIFYHKTDVTASIKQRILDNIKIVLQGYEPCTSKQARIQRVGTANSVRIELYCRMVKG